MLWNEEPGRHIKKLERDFVELFSAYQPRKSDDRTGAFGFPTYEFLASADDVRVRKLLRDFDSLLKQSKPAVAAFYLEMPTPDELNRTRYLQPYFYSSYITEGPKGELNPKLVTCKFCLYPNLKFMPEPLLVSKAAQKNYDIFHTGFSAVVVRPWVLELLKQVVADEIVYGKAGISQPKTGIVESEPLFWVRPRNMIGEAVIISDGEKTCSSCNRTMPNWLGAADSQVTKNGPGLLNHSEQVEHFGTGNFHIALVDKIRAGKWPTIVMSGALLAFLKEQSVKGIVSYTKQLWPQCIFSRKGETPLEPQPHKLGTKPAKPAKITNAKTLEQGRSITRTLRDVAWDGTKDGHVYFYLTSPEFVALDPMTAEESDCVYKVKDFEGAGLYRFPVSAIKRAKEEDGIAVDSATLLFVDNQFLGALLDEYEWEKASKKNGDYHWAYHQQIAEKVGTRFGICSASPAGFKTAFDGDGCFTIDVKKIKKVQP